MKRTQLLSILIISVFLLCSCSDNSKKAIDFGTFESGVYLNRYFNLEVKVPESWHVLDDESRVEMMRKGSKIVAGDNENLNAVLKATDLQNINLLTASEHPIGAPVPFNPTFIIIAEKVKHLPGIVKGRDYHFHTKELMKSSPLKVSYPKEIYEVLVGELTFDVMEFEINMGQTIITQKQYAAIINDYALLFALTYSNDKDLESLTEIVQGLNLKL